MVLVCLLIGRAEAVEVSASAAVLMDMDSGRVLYEKLEKGGVFRLNFPDCLLPELPEVRSARIPETGFSVVDMELSVL